MGVRMKILIVDDHPIVRIGLQTILEKEEDLTVCGETGKANEAIHLMNKLKPDLVLVDINLEGSESGLDLIKSMQKKHPLIPALVFSMYNEMLYAERAIMAGAKGYIRKNELQDNVVTAIRDVLKGGIYLQKEASLNIVNNLLRTTSKKPITLIDRLTNREFEVFRLLGRGFGTRKISNMLDLSVNTIETYRRNICKKLNLKTSDELVRYAIHWTINN